jgi:hypothetical protein
MDLSPEALAAIINVAGKWSSKMATTPHPTENPRAKATSQPSEISRDLETHFNWAFSYLEKYVREYGAKSLHWGKATADALIAVGIIAAIAAILIWTLGFPFWAFLVLMILIVLILASGFYRLRHP